MHYDSTVRPLISTPNVRSFMSSTIYCVLSLFCVLCLASSKSAPSWARDRAPEVAIHFIDIGQGDSALIVGPTGKTVLLDTGPSKSWGALSAYLDALKINKIDLLINSHPHADHIGNAARALERYQIKRVLDSGFVHPIRAYRNMLETIKAHNVKLILARKGREIGIGGGAKIEVLGPQDPLISNSRSDPNSNSIIFRLTYKGRAALFTGDAEAETERRLLTDPKRLRADLLKVAHHGSAHASSRAFLRAVTPRHAVVSCGSNNRYGHPAPETLGALKEAQAQVWVTASAGSIVATTRGGDWTLKPSTVKIDPARARSRGPRVASYKPLPATQGATHPSATSQPTARNPSVTPAQAQAQGTVNVNTASAPELKTLPRIGVKLAARIIEARKTGAFTSPDDLRARVRGIGAKTAAKLAPLISF